MTSALPLSQLRWCVTSKKKPTIFKGPLERHFLKQLSDLKIHIYWNRLTCASVWNSDCKLSRKDRISNLMSSAKQTINLYALERNTSVWTLACYTRSCRNNTQRNSYPTAVYRTGVSYHNRFLFRFLWSIFGMFGVLFNLVHLKSLKPASWFSLIWNAFPYNFIISYWGPVESHAWDVPLLRW